MSINHSVRSGDVIGVSIFLSMKISCVFSLESPHRGDSNEYTQNTIFDQEKKKIILIYPESAAVTFPKGFKNNFETAIVDELSVFEPPTVYCEIDTNKHKSSQL